MAENSSEQEPSIEEILASIRQIISDDDEQEAAPAKEAEPPPAPEPEPEPEPEPAPEPKEDVLELTPEMAEEPAVPEPEIDLQETAPPPPPPAPKPPPPAEEEPSAIMSDSTKSSALSSMTKLAGGMPVSRRSHYDGITLEDIVRDMLHPMLREWMDDNLPGMVERLVQKELEKLSRRAMDE